MPSPLFPGSSASSEREDPETLLLQAVIERQEERSLELVQRLVHRRGLAALGAFQHVTLPRLVDDEARSWLATLLLQVPQGTAAGSAPDAWTAPVAAGVTAAAQEDLQRHGPRASAAVDAAIAAMVAEFPELAPSVLPPTPAPSPELIPEPILAPIPEAFPAAPGFRSPHEHSEVEGAIPNPTPGALAPGIDTDSAPGIDFPPHPELESDPFADFLATAFPEPLVTRPFGSLEPVLPSPPHDPPELAAPLPGRLGAAGGLAGRLRRRLGGIRSQVIGPLTSLLASSPQPPSLTADPAPFAPAETLATEPEATGLRAARGSHAQRSPTTAWEHAPLEPAPVPAALADLRAWLPDSAPRRIR